MTNYRSDLLPTNDNKLQKVWFKYFDGIRLRKLTELLFALRNLGI